MSQKRKILMIIMDQFRGDLVASGGACVTGKEALSDHIKLPNIDALRQEAVTFAAHYSVVNPCGPARASIFTGMYAMNHRSVRNGTPLADGIPNVALEARKSGYDPLLYGYTDTSIDPRGRHENDPDLRTEEHVLPGVTEALEMRYQESYPWRAYLKSKGYDIPEYARFYDPISPDPTRAARADDPPFYKAEHSDTAFATDVLIHDLSVRCDQDWFALVTYLRPHPPLVAPAPYNTMYKGADLPLPPRMARPEDEAAVHPFMEAALVAPPMDKTVRGEAQDVDPENDADVQMLRALYLGLATEVDTHIGRIVAFLKDTGQYDDTVILLMSDHGEVLGEHHMWGKQNPYEAAYHVPLIIRDPQYPEQFGNTINAFTESIDVAPTILDLIGQRAPASMDGASLRPFLVGETPEDWRDAVHLELDFSEPDKPTVWQKATGTSVQASNLAVLRETRYKLVHFNGGLRPMLFDMLEDPHEMCNLAEDSAHMKTLLRMTQKLLSHRMKHGDGTLTSYKVTAQGAIEYRS